MLTEPSCAFHNTLGDVILLKGSPQPKGVLEATIFGVPKAKRKEDRDEERRYERRAARREQQRAHSIIKVREMNVYCNHYGLDLAHEFEEYMGGKDKCTSDLMPRNKFCAALGVLLGKATSPGLL